MQIDIQKPYTDFIDKIIALGFANDANEVVRQSLLLYRDKMEFEELYLVDKAVKSEMQDLLKSSEKLTDIEEIFKDAGI